MFEKFTEPARRIIFFARYEAAQLGSVSIEPEHLFLGILREGGTAAGHLRGSGFDLEALRSKTVEALPRGGVASTAIDIPLSRAAKEALDIAMEEGRVHPTGAVGPEELLIGIFREGKNGAARVLAEAAFDAEGLRSRARSGLWGRWPCRRCGQMLSPATVVPTIRMRLEVDGYPTPPLASLTAAVCVACGLVELGVEDPARLRDQ